MVKKSYIIARMAYGGSIGDIGKIGARRASSRTAWPVNDGVLRGWHRSAAQQLMALRWHSAWHGGA